MQNACAECRCRSPHRSLSSLVFASSSCASASCHLLIANRLFCPVHLRQRGFSGFCLCLCQLPIASFICVYQRSSAAIALCSCQLPTTKYQIPLLHSFVIMEHVRLVTDSRPIRLNVPIKMRRRDGRVAEGARLESVFRGNSNVGSNPTLSASFLSAVRRNPPLIPALLRGLPRNCLLLR